MKRCIVVFGNIASGKSTLCRALAQVLPAQHLCLDNILIKRFLDNASENKFARKHACEQEFLEQTQQPFILYETTYNSDFCRKTITALSKTHMMYFVCLECSPDVCLQRFEDRRALDFSARVKDLIMPSQGDLRAVAAQMQKNASVYPSKKADLRLDAQLSTAEMVSQIIRALKL